MPAEAHPVLNRLKEPIPLPEAYDARKMLVQRLEAKVRRARAFRAIAEVCQLPQWAAIRDSAVKVVEGILDRLPTVMGQERDQLIGELGAWRNFMAGPEQALVEVRRLDQEISDLEKALRNGNKQA